jgi:hypothetical protein
MPKKLLFVAIAALALTPASRATAGAEADRAAAQKIAQELKTSGQLKDYKIGVKYQDGVAWIMGTVTSAEQKQIAERLANQCAGVDRVISKLEIEGVAASEQTDDVQLAGGVDSGEYESQAEMPQQVQPMAAAPRQARRPAGNGNMPVPYARMGGQGPIQQANYGGAACPPGAMGGMSGPGAIGAGGGMGPQGYAPTGMGQAVSYDNPQMPGYAWPSYAAYPNYAGVSYPQQYSPTAWPYIGPFYPYPQVPLGWRKVTLEWDDGWWFLDFKDQRD